MAGAEAVLAVAVACLLAALDRRIRATEPAREVTGAQVPLAGVAYGTIRGPHRAHLCCRGRCGRLITAMLTSSRTNRSLTSLLTCVWVGLCFAAMRCTVRKCYAVACGATSKCELLTTAERRVGSCALYTRTFA